MSDIWQHLMKEELAKHSVFLDEDAQMPVEFSIGFCQSDHVRVRNASIPLDAIAQYLPGGYIEDHTTAFLPRRFSHLEALREIFGDVDGDTDIDIVRRDGGITVVQEPECDELYDRLGINVDEIAQEMVKDGEKATLNKAHDFALRTVENEVLREYQTQHFVIRIEADVRETPLEYDMDPECMSDLIQAVIDREIELIPELVVTLFFFEDGVPEDESDYEGLADQVERERVCDTDRPCKRGGYQPLPHCARDLVREIVSEFPRGNELPEHRQREAA